MMGDSQTFEELFLVQLNEVSARGRITLGKKVIFPGLANRLGAFFRGPPLFPERTEGV